MVGQEQVREGMVVRDEAGRRLGHVGAVGDGHFELEHGVLGRHVWQVDFAHVRLAHGDELVVERSAHLEPVEDDAGGALPPHDTQGLESEPVNR